MSCATATARHADLGVASIRRSPSRQRSDGTLLLDRELPAEPPSGIDVCSRLRDTNLESALSDRNGGHPGLGGSGES